MKLLVRELLGFGLLASLSAAGGFFGYLNTHAVSEAFDEVNGYNYPATQAMLRIENRIYYALLQGRDAAHTGNLRQVAEYRQALYELHRHLALFRKMTLDMEAITTPPMKADIHLRLKHIESSIGRLESRMNDVVSRARQGRRTTEGDYLQVNQAAQTALAVLESAIEKESTEAAHNSVRASAVLTVSLYRLIGIIGVAFAASVLLGLYFTRLVTMPLRQLQAGARQIAGGSLAVKLRIDSSDEFGEVARTFNMMAQNLRDYRARLKASKAYTETILSSMREALFVVTPDAKILRTNRAAGKLLGIPCTARAQCRFQCPRRSSFPIGESLLALTACSPDKDRLAEILRDSDGFHRVEISLCSTTDGPMPVLLSSAPMLVPGTDVRQIICVAHDLRRTRLLEQLNQANRELQANNLRLHELDRLKDDFLAVTSHELRTPLTAILGFAELLRAGMGGLLTPEQEEYIGIIWERGQDLRRIVEDILDFTRLQNGLVALTLERIYLPDLLADCLQTMAGQVAEKQLQTDLQHIEVAARWVQADARRVRQIVLNLLSNSVKFTPPGGLIRLYAERNDHSEVVISVSDSGIGVASEFHQAIFDRFRQVQSHLSRTTEGLGLGLTITRMLVERQGGRIDVASQPGQGATFQFTLPAADEAAQAA